MVMLVFVALPAPVVLLTAPAFLDQVLLRAGRVGVLPRAARRDSTG